MRVDNLPVWACIQAQSGRLSTLICYAFENPRSFVFCLHLEEELVEAGVVVELGVEGDTKLIVLTGGDDTAIDFG